MVREAIRELRGSPSPGCSACWPRGSRRGRGWSGPSSAWPTSSSTARRAPGQRPYRVVAKHVLFSSRTRWRPSRPIRPLGRKRP